MRTRRWWPGQRRQGWRSPEGAVSASWQSPSGRQFGICRFPQRYTYDPGRNPLVLKRKSSGAALDRPASAPQGALGHADAQMTSGCRLRNPHAAGGPRPGGVQTDGAVTDGAIGHGRSRLERTDEKRRATRSRQGPGGEFGEPEPRRAKDPAGEPRGLGAGTPRRAPTNPAACAGTYHRSAQTPNTPGWPPTSRSQRHRKVFAPASARPGSWPLGRVAAAASARERTGAVCAGRRNVSAFASVNPSQTR